MWQREIDGSGNNSIRNKQTISKQGLPITGFMRMINCQRKIVNQLVRKTKNPRKTKKSGKRKIMTRNVINSFTIKKDNKKIKDNKEKDVEQRREERKQDEEIKVMIVGKESKIEIEMKGVSSINKKFKQPITTVKEGYEQLN